MPGGLKIGIQIPHSDPARASIPDLIRKCQLAEKNGFDSIWLEDHVLGGDPSSIVWLECFTLLTAMALNTRKTVFGPIVTDVLRREPVTLAQTVASLDRISDGRFVLGLGAGEAMNLAPYGVDMERLVSKLEEAIKVMKLLWAASPSRRADFRGEHYSLSDAYMQVRPVQKPHPPIYIGAFGKRMLELTGRLADGWVPTQHSPETYKATLKVIHEHARRAGRKTSSIEPVLCLLGCVRKDGDEARRKMVGTAKLCVALFPDIMAALVPQARSPGPEFTMVRLREGNWKVLYESAKDIPTDKALTTVIAGNVQDVIEQIEGFAEAGVKHLVISLRDSDDDQVIRDFGSKVIPYFRGR